MPAKILQVSDCHLARDPRADYRGHNADANLELLTDAVRRWAPDLLMLTGDLSEDGSAESYARIRDWAERFDCRTAWIPGNHDARGVMAPIFDAAGFRSGPLIDAGGWQLVLLDSAWPNDPGGELDAERLAPLEAVDGDRPAGIFVHHQPVPVGAAWIDKVGMREAGRLWARVRRIENARFVAFGHVHQRFRQSNDGVTCLACPSTAANSLPATPRFTPGETTPMARWFVLDGQAFHTGYLAA